MKQTHSSDLPLFATAIILAGGQSHRMGFDKQTIRLGEGTLVDQIAERLSGVFTDIVVVTNRPELYTSMTEGHRHVRAVSDVFPGKGPMAGVHAGLLTAESQYVYVIGCDMPHLVIPFIEQMRQELEARLSCRGETEDEEVPLPAGVMLRRDNGQLEPLNAFYHKNLAASMADRLTRGAHSLHEFCHGQPFVWFSQAKASMLDPESRMYLNLNDPSDLEKWRADLGEEADFVRPLTKPVLLRRVTRDKSCLLEDRVVREGLLTIELNGTVVAELYALPERWKDLCVGWLKTDRAIDCYQDIDQLE
ncbi:MAG TPA: molybdenum cofactor guanylyltransferase, partial [Clostridia bacterium]|nr:molybdenum cofactor guanylyltransferase [Clostridia bacterium]